MVNILYLGEKIIVLGESLIKPNSINKKKKNKKRSIKPNNREKDLTAGSMNICKKAK